MCQKLNVYFMAKMSFYRRDYWISRGLTLILGSRPPNESGHHLLLLLLLLTINRIPGCTGVWRFLCAFTLMRVPVRLLTKMITVRCVPAAIKKCFTSALSAPLFWFNFVDATCFFLLCFFTNFLNSSQSFSFETYFHLPQRSICNIWHYFFNLKYSKWLPVTRQNRG